MKTRVIILSTISIILWKITRLSPLRMIKKLTPHSHTFFSLVAYKHISYCIDLIPISFSYSIHSFSIHLFIDPINGFPEQWRSLLFFFHSLMDLWCHLELKRWRYPCRFYQPFILVFVPQRNLHLHQWYSYEGRRNFRRTYPCHKKFIDFGYCLLWKLCKVQMVLGWTCLDCLG